MERKYIRSKSLWIQAGISKVFSVLTDIDNWSRWTASVTEIKLTGERSFNVGGTARVVQPGLAPAIWTITEIMEDRAFVWQTKRLGAVITAVHHLESKQGGTLAVLEICYEGPLALLYYCLSARLTDEYLLMEISGLKKECER